MFSPLNLCLTNHGVKHYVPSLMTKAYISNISPLWPVERQEAMLPDGVVVFRDVLTPKERQAHRTAALVQRAEMLRPSTRRNGEEIYIASLAVLDWTAEGMMEALTAAMARGATVRVLDAGLSIGPTARVTTLYVAAVAFAAARKRSQEVDRGRAGGEASARKRSEASKARALTIKAEWGMPEPPTAILLARAGLSYNTAKLHLGPRPAAQRAYQAAQKRKAKRK